MGSEMCIRDRVDTVPFRNLVSVVVDTEDYHDVANKASEVKSTKVKRSQLFTMLKRGGVLYVKKNKMQKLTDKLDNSVFQAIGYNYYQKIVQNEQ